MVLGRTPFAVPRAGRVALLAVESLRLLMRVWAFTWGGPAQSPLGSIMGKQLERRAVIAAYANNLLVLVSDDRPGRL